MLWVIEMVFTCDNCHYIFKCAVAPEQCPDCGKYTVRPADDPEQREYVERMEKTRGMRIVMNLYYTGVNNSAHKFVEEMEQSGTADLIRKESGNERYAYFFSADDPETVLLIDIWADQHSLDLHHASPMMETVLRLRTKYGLHVRAERYISDEQGIPESDLKFVHK